MVVESCERPLELYPRQSVKIYFDELMQRYTRSSHLTI